MKRNWGLIGIGLSLLVLAALVFAYPHRMIAPGALSPGHAGITHDCFACHAPLRGARPAKCMACHIPRDIGIKTTKGAPIIHRRSRIAFHTALVDQNCTACHSDHARPRLAQHAHKPFAHQMLKSAVQGQCASCHKAPNTVMHKSIIGNCAQCHSATGWRPATFDHNRYFRLGGDHNAPCATCHVGGNYARYTCFGCHEHQLERIRSIENCVRCHRSSDEVEGEVCANLATAEDAIAAAVKHDPDLLIIDAGLGEGSGIDAVAQIVAARPVAHIFMTGNVAAVRRQCPQAIILAKPFHEADLASAIEKASPR